MVQTKEGAARSEWLLYMKKCAEAYNKHKRENDQGSQKRNTKTTTDTGAASSKETHHKKRKQLSL